MIDMTENGRVTLAVLGQKLDMVIGKLDDLESCYRQDHDKLSRLEMLADEGRRIAIDARAAHTRLDEKVNTIDTRDKVWGGINSLALVIGSLLGMKVNL